MVKCKRCNFDSLELTGSALLTDPPQYPMHCICGARAVMVRGNVVYEEEYDDQLRLPFPRKEYV
jgi:hypothetical protein